MPSGIEWIFTASGAIVHNSPVFLTRADVPILRVRCPVHGFIHFSRNERAIIDHPVFQRLRYIRQLALTDMIYPGATHTRFEHSLGVMEVATRAFDSLAMRHGSILYSLFRQHPEFRGKTMAKARQVLRLAAMLHDVGHAPFSHAAEGLFHRDQGHEAMSLHFIAGEGEETLRKTLDSLFWAGAAASVASLVGKSAPARLRLLQDLVSGEMDADRTDYLQRDSLHCGVDYGRFEYRRMIECLEIDEDAGGPAGIALNRDGLHTFEALILARYQMNTQVYHHRIRGLLDEYLRRFLVAQPGKLVTSPKQLLQMNDVRMLERIFAAGSRGGPGSPWARRLVERRFHKLVFESGFNADAEDRKTVAALEDGLRRKFGRIEFVVTESSGAITKLFQPGDHDDKNPARLYLIRPGQPRESIVSASQVLRKIERRFCCLRIFADTGEAGRELDALRKFSRDFWQKHRN